MKEKMAIMKTLSNLSVNLSAGWFGAAFITPNFSQIIGIKEFFLLLLDIAFGILFLWFCYKLERSLL